MSWAGLALIVTFPLSACGDQPAPSEGAPAADCSGAIRHGGINYSNHSFTDHEGTPFGEVDEADCHDNGESGKGTSSLRSPAGWTP